MINRYSQPEMSAIWTLENKFQKWLDVEIAACEAHHKLGNIPAKDLKTIKSKAKFSTKRIAEIEAITDHDVIAFLTNLSETIGPSSRFVHLGLTSSDVVDTANSVLLREAADLLLKRISTFITVLKSKAQLTRNMIMIGRTHGMHAEPTTFGMKMLLWYEEMKRHKTRLINARESINIGIISGTVGTYSNIDPKIEQLVCAKLKLTPAPISTQIIQRDRHAEFINTLAMIASSLEKFATEIRHLQRTDISEAAEPFKKGQKGSSAMPHKRNPIISERITGLARVLRGYSITAMENISLWHERDISHSGAERIIFPDSTILLDYMFHIFTQVIQDLELFPDRMKKNMDVHGGIVFSQTVLLSLVKSGISREAAYKIVQRNALKAIDDNSSFRELIKSDKDALKQLSEKDITALFNYEDLIKNIDFIYARVLK